MSSEVSSRREWWLTNGREMLPWRTSTVTNRSLSMALPTNSQTADLSSRTESCFRTVTSNLWGLYKKRDRQEEIQTVIYWPGTYTRFKARRSEIYGENDLIFTHLLTWRWRSCLPTAGTQWTSVQVHKHKVLSWAASLRHNNDYTIDTNRFVFGGLLAEGGRDRQMVQVSSIYDHSEGTLLRSSAVLGRFGKR